MSKNILYLEISFDEMQRLYAAQVSGFDSIKTNVRAVLSAASLIVSLVSALQILTVRVVPGYLWLYQTGVGLAAILYVVLVSLCIMALLPIKVITPLSPDWDELVTAYKGLSEKEALMKRLSSTLNAIESNQPMVERFRKMQMGALILLPVLVVMLLLLTLIPRI